MNFVDHGRGAIVTPTGRRLGTSSDFPVDQELPRSWQPQGVCGKAHSVSQDSLSEDWTSLRTQDVR